MSLSNYTRNAVIDDIISTIASNLEPEDVFDNNALSKWAEQNGYVKEDED